MESFHGLRVSADSFYAGAVCNGAAAGLRARSTRRNGSLWSWAGSLDGKYHYGLNYYKRRPENLLISWAQDDYLRAAQKIFSHCPELLTSNKLFPTLPRRDAFSSAYVLSRSGRSAYEYGKKRRPPALMPFSGMKRICFADLGPSLHDMVEGPKWGERMDLDPQQLVHACKDGGLYGADLPPYLTAWTKLIRSRGFLHSINRGVAACEVQMRDRQDRGPDLEDSSPDRAKYCRSGVVLPHKEQKQIFIRSTEGRHVCVQIWDQMSILELKKEIQDKLGIPVAYQILIFLGKSMQDQLSLQHYRVEKDSTIILSHRLRGGSKGSTSKSTSTYRDAAKGKRIHSC